nr:FG-GAP-like repeat-containing protein [uncultured Macellibacteroides sp.]
MKIKILTTLIFLFLLTDVNAIPSLKIEENDSIVARDTSRLSEIMLPDYYRDIFAGKGNIDIARPELSQPMIILNNTYAVGTIEGQAGVSSSGAATYQIPIEVPNGIAGHKPNVSITYNSQSGVGLLGYGWNISASSSISRSGKSIYYDNVSEAPNLSNTDNLILDGQRLLLESGSNLANGAKYRTEVEGYSTITYKVINSYACFEVKTPDGKILEYGSTSDSYIESTSGGAALFWLLSKVTDNKGNTITYTYNEIANNGEFYLTSIQYAGNRKVSLTYEDRSDKQISYVAGVAVNTRKIIKKLTTSIGSTVVKEYLFNHVYDGYYSKLTEIVEQGQNNERYNSTQINYGMSDVYGNEYLSTLSTNRQGNKPLFADFNGDGKTDFLSYPEKSSYTTSDVATLFLANNYYGDVSFSQKCTIPLTSGFSHILLADVNGDSKIDAIVVSLAPNGTYRYNYYTYEVDRFVYNYKGFNTNGSTGIAGDFNGDGKFEILVKENQKVFNGEGQEIASGGIDNWGKMYAYCFPNNNYLSDFNGNGKTDILVLNETGSWVYELNGNSFTKLTSFSNSMLNNTYFPYLGDFNGDGKTDILYQNVQQGNYNDVSILFSTGKSFIRQSTSDVNIRAKVQVGDFNKDGKADIFHMEIVDGKVVMKIGTYDGTRFVTKNYSSLLSPSDLTVPYEYDNYLFPIADFNGDGRAEFCFARYVDAYFIHTFDDEQTLLAKTISNGLGENISFNYQPITDEVTCKIEESVSFPLSNPRFPLQVVRSMSVAGNNYYDNTTYYYKNPRIHKQGKGFIGFGEVEARNNSTSINTITKYGYDTSYYYPWVLEQKQTTSTGTPITTATTENATVYEAPKRFFPYVRKQTVTDHLKGTIVTTDLINIEYGKPKTIIKKYGNDLTETTTTVFQNVTTENKWILGLPITVEKKTTRGGNDWIEKSAYQYNTDNKLSLKQMYTNDGTKQVSEEAYTYDRFGNVTYTTLKAFTSANLLKTYYHYSLDGIYETVLTDPMNRTIVKSYNILGQVSTSTDIWGNVTKYEYDGMGRLKKSNYPDGTQAVVTRAWSSDANSVFSITKEETGKPTLTTFYNTRGLELRTSRQRFNDSRILTDNIYDNAGRLTKTSLPFKTGAATLWNTYEYDVYGRLKLLNYASGKSDVYTYTGNSVTETKDGITITRTYNAKEELIGTSDPAGAIVYQMRPDGQPSSITTPGPIVTRFSYDGYGRQTEINDPSIGLKLYEYDDAGNIKSETDANGEIKRMEYDSYGRITKRILPEYETTFMYDGYGALKSEKSTNNTSKSYDYDGLGRLLFSQENVDDRWGGYNYNYSPTTGNLESKDYISSTEGYVVTENYTYQNGSLTEIKRDGLTSIWKLQEENVFGQPTKISTGPLTRTYTYSDYGLPTASMVNSEGTVIQNYGMLFNPVTGNLTSRGDHKNSKYEQFQYDNLNRLTHVYAATSLTSGVASNPTNVYSYSANGNLENKSDAGKYSYGDPAKPYAVTSVALSGNAIPVRLQEITYTSFERPSVLTENNYMATFTYDGSGERSKMEIKRYNNSQILRYYLNGSHEVDVTPAGEKERLYLGGDAYSAPSVLVKENGSWNIYYICRDHLGSITQITNGSGVMQQELSYDAWGRLRNPSTLAVYAPDTEPTLFLGRGYTGHEHLTMFGLVNMNARLYDPAVGRFLSPDPYVQMADFSQNYNRFSYAMNNPLVYIDKDGEVLGLFIIGGALIGSYIGASVKGGSFNPAKWQGAWWQGALWGGAIGAVSGALVGSMWAAGGINIAFSGNVYNLSVPLGSVSVSSAGYGSVSLGTGIWGSGGLVYTFGNKKEDSLLEANLIREEGLKSLERFNQMMQDGGSFYMGTGVGIVGETLYSKDLGTWMGKDFKIRNQSWGGNKQTGGKYKFAKNLARPFQFVSSALGFYDMYISTSKAWKGEMSHEEAIGDVIFGGVSLYSGFWGGWANFWYGLGKEYGPMKTYLKHQEEKK